MILWGSLDPSLETPELENVVKAYRNGFRITRNGFFCCIEYERATLQEEVCRLHSLETMLREVEESRQNLEKELRSTQTLLDKERAKNHSVQHQNEVFLFP